MRIIDPGHRSTPAIYQPASPPPLTGAAGFPSTPEGTLAGQLATLFANTGLDVSAEETALLAVALLERGFSAGEMTTNTALRALMFQRNDVPLLPEAVSAPAAPGASLLPEASRLLETASSLLSEMPASEDPNGALRTLVRNLSTLLGPEMVLSPEAAETAGDPSRVSVLRTPLLQRNDVPLLPEIVSAPTDSGASLLPEASRLLGTASSLLSKLPAEKAPDEALRTLIRDISAFLVPKTGLQPEVVSEPATSGASLIPNTLQLLEAASVLLSKLPADEATNGTLRTLVRNLSAFLVPETVSPPETAGTANDSTRVSARTGAAFEWRLLAWYRAGRDPEALASLIRGDLKGTLLAFLGTVERAAARNPKLKSAEDHARSLLDRITGRQTDLLTESARERMGIPAEIPFGAPEERMYAGVRAKRGESGTPTPGAERCTLTIDIETTRLGPVRARLRFIGKDVAATFLLNDRKTIALAESMASEFREMLRSRGYEPVLVRFTTASEHTAYPDGAPSRAGIMNRRG